MPATSLLQRAGLLLVLLPAPVLAAQLRLLAADRTGATLELRLEGYALATPGADGRQALTSPGLESWSEPGRPLLPGASATLGLPPGMRAVARVLEREAEERQGVRLALGTEPYFERSADGGPEIPARRAVPPVLDGPYPSSPVSVSAPQHMRGQWFVGVKAIPFVYDEPTGRLTAITRLTLRVDFVPAEAGDAGLEDQGAPAPVPQPQGEDRHFEGVFRAGLLNYEQARSWRVPRRAARPAALAAPRRVADETRPEVRVRIDTTGVYRVDFEQLQSAGFPTGIPIAELEAHRHEYVLGLADPPFTSVPVPIEPVDLDGNTAFGPGDYLLFYAQSYADRARPGNYQKYWGSEDYLFVSSSASGGARILPRTANLGYGLTTPEPWFHSRRHYERNFHFLPFPPDTTVDLWYWATNAFTFDVRPTPPDSFRFECVDQDTTVPLTVSAAWRGAVSAFHAVWADVLNGRGGIPGMGDSTSVVDSLVWVGLGERIATRTMPGSAVTPGLTNRIRLMGYGGGGVAGSLTNFNWFDITHGRRYRAIADYLECHSSTASGPALFRVGGFSLADSLRVYDVTDSTAPVRLVLDPGQVKPDGPGFSAEWEDTVAAGRPHRYVAFRAARTLPDAYVTRVDRRRLTAAPPGGRVDYVVVTHEAFEPALAPLLALRQSQGLSVMVAPAQAVYDEFDGGRKSPYAIRRFLRFAYNNWGSRFVLLVGDGTQDPLYHSGQPGADYLPAPYIQGPVTTSQGAEVVNSDLWYVWCLNGGCGPGPQYPDLYVGRLPVSRPQEAQEVVAKIVAYEQFSAADAWRNRIVLSADDAYSFSTFLNDPTGYCFKLGELVFRDIMEANRQVILSEGKLRGTQVTPFYLGDFLPDPRDCSRDLDATRSFVNGVVTPQLRALLTSGALFWDYQGHANAFVLGHEYFWQSQFGNYDVNQVDNPGKPFVFAGYACHINQFGRVNEGDSFGDGMGERFVTVPGRRGAVASYASTGFEILPGTAARHLDIALVRALFSQPPFDPYLGDRGARVVLGEAIATAYLRFLPVAGFLESGVSLTYVLLGDPALRMTVAGPQSFVTANGDTVREGQTVRLHTPGDTLHLRADIASNNSIKRIQLEYVQGGSTVVLPDTLYSLTPSFPDTLVNGGRFYALRYDTTLAAATYSYVIRTTDRFDVTTTFRIPFDFATVLRVDGAAIADGDIVAPDANLSLLVLVPRPVTPAEMILTVAGQPQAFVATGAPGDTSGREWVLSWTHGPLPKGVNAAELAIGGERRTRTFSVTSGADALRLEQVAAFPNPFEDDLGCHFSFVLNTGARADLLLRVFTPSGRLVYDRVERDLNPGYHQLAWDGRDAEGNKLANGIYLYRLIARNPQVNTVFTGRLVKLRKPRRVPEPTVP